MKIKIIKGCYHYFSRSESKTERKKTKIISRTSWNTEKINKTKDDSCIYSYR